MRKPPAAPAPRPKLDPSRLWQERREHQQEPGPGRRRARCPLRWAAAVATMERASARSPAGDPRIGLRPSVSEAKSHAVQQLRALRGGVYAPLHEDGSSPLPGSWGPPSSGQVGANHRPSGARVTVGTAASTVNQGKLHTPAPIGRATASTQCRCKAAAQC